ncbi:MAG TPA: type VI secretion system baseplate subunit TssK, partial [Gemmatimonadales bacterium]|nr:type VI secretion system baseplate subunit TssK [Gemmatimonadales bacterium]
PDGLLFDFPDSDQAPAPKPLAEQFAPDQKTIDIYLAVPEYRPGGSNVSAAQSNQHTRFLAEAVLRRDENTGLAEKPIQVARKNLRLLVEGESLDGSSVLRVARVQRGSTGELTLDSQFVPPLLDIGASDHLLAVARRLIEILSAKSSTLSGSRRQKNQSLAEFSVADVANFWLLYTINTHLPQIRHLFEVRRGHPAELFEAMSALAGALTTFSTTLHPRVLPVYDHAELSACFGDLDDKLRTLLETVVPSNCVSLPLKMVQPSIYATAIDQDRYFAAPQLYLAISADINASELLRKVPQLIKVSSADRLDRLIKQALPGVGLTHTPNPPSAIPVKLKYHYFLLNKAGSEWDGMGLARNLAAYVPADFPNAELELVVVLPPK